jgi:hypothetical protein
MKEKHFSGTKFYDERENKLLAQFQGHTKLFDIGD